MKASPDIKTSIGLAINAGIDMMMVPSELTYGPLLKELVDEKVVPMSRINDAVRRILRLKAKVGLLDDEPEVGEYPLFGSPEFAAKAYQAAVESEVLLKNEGVLPLPTNARILLCGPNANTMRGLSGGWTYTHQGSKTEHISAPYNTILEAMQARFPRLIYEPGVEYDENGAWVDEKKPQIAKAVAAASRADYIVCCIGENSYAETQGSIRDINLSQNQKDLVKALAATGKPVILILNEGRPRVIHDIEPLAGAIVCVMLPSNYGGDALAALLAGEENFSGRLPFTYPAFPNGLTTYNYKVMEDRSTTPGIYNYSNNTMAQWWFGHGLSYTTFEYGNLSADKAEFGADDTIRFTVDVTNTGDRAGKETVLLFVSDDIASVMPDNRRLRAFEKIELQPGESRTVSLEVPARDLAFVGFDDKRHLEAGSFTVLAGGQFLNIQCTETVVF
jgi:beta-glucosidase